jgi:hypothetical protein
VEVIDRLNPSIDANNRLILGQVFLWLEAETNWCMVWDDSQIFETKEDYTRFKIIWEKYKKEKEQITYRCLPV